jgi:hypothetical protein
MEGGEISGNNAIMGNPGGGVLLVSGSSFAMSGGEIIGNTTSSSGGGVAVGTNSQFSMTGGEISGNTGSSGGGVYVQEKATFIKTGGTIYGNGAGAKSDNAENGKGHAVYATDKFRDSTAGPDIAIDTEMTGTAGGWEN